MIVLWSILVLMRRNHRALLARGSRHSDVAGKRPAFACVSNRKQVLAGAMLYIRESLEGWFVHGEKRESDGHLN